MALTLSPLVINSELHLELADPYLEEENILWQLRGSPPAPQPGKSRRGPSHRTPPPQGSPEVWGYGSPTWVEVSTLGVGSTA